MTSADELEQSAPDNDHIDELDTINDNFSISGGGAGSSTGNSGASSTDSESPDWSSTAFWNFVDYNFAISRTAAAQNNATKERQEELLKR